MGPLSVKMFSDEYQISKQGRSVPKKQRIRILSVL